MNQRIYVVCHLLTVVTCVIFEQVQNTKRLKVLQSSHTSSNISCALKCIKNKYDNYRYEGGLCECLSEHYTGDLYERQVYSRIEVINELRSSRIIETKGEKIIIFTVSPPLNHR